MTVHVHLSTADAQLLACMFDMVSTRVEHYISALAPFEKEPWCAMHSIHIRVHYRRITLSLIVAPYGLIAWRYATQPPTKPRAGRHLTHIKLASRLRPPFVDSTNRDAPELYISQLSFKPTFPFCLPVLVQNRRYRNISAPRPRSMRSKITKLIGEQEHLISYKERSNVEQQVCEMGTSARDQRVR